MASYFPLPHFSHLGIDEKTEYLYYYLIYYIILEIYTQSYVRLIVYELNLGYLHHNISTIVLLNDLYL